MSGTNLDYRPFDAQRDRDRVAHIISHAFGTSPELCEKWLDHLGPGFRVLTQDAVVVATGLLYDCGQFFGGRAVPMLGVGGVTVAAEARGRGVAREIMRQIVLEMHELGAPISTLFPATQRLYQSVGFEQAGHLVRYDIPTDAIHECDTSLDVRMMREDERGEVKALYRSQSQHLDGYVDRDDWLWDRVFFPRGKIADCYVVGEASGPIEGYATLLQRHSTGDDRTQLLTDVQFSTPRGARRLLRFLRDHSSTIRTITFYGGPQHPLCFLLGEQRYEVTRQDYWMTRILDVPQALEARGYASGLSARAEFEITDELFPSNAKCWALTIEQGQPSLSEGGAGTIKLDVGHLAPLYTGFMHPAQLRALGFLDCSDDQVETLSSLFSGPAPSMVEHF